MLHIIVLHIIVLHSIVLHIIVLHIIVLHIIVLHIIVLHSIVLFVYIHTAAVYLVGRAIMIPCTSSPYYTWLLDIKANSTLGGSPRGTRGARGLRLGEREDKGGRGRHRVLDPDQGRDQRHGGGING